MYVVGIKPLLDKKLEKLYKKNRKHFDIITKKSGEIRRNPHHYKNLRAPMQEFKRVHIDKHFVLTFTVDEKQKVVWLEDYDHHDNIYHL